MRATLQSFNRACSKMSSKTKLQSDISSAKYSTHRVCSYEKDCNDKSALTNNPPVVTAKGTTRHMEVTRETCDAEPNCVNKICPTLCGPLKEEKSVGHLTSGNVNNAEGQTVNLGNTNINGAPKNQNVFIYKEPHKTSSTQTEIPNGTNYVRKPDVEKIIHDFENKK